MLKTHIYKPILVIKILNNFYFILFFFFFQPAVAQVSIAEVFFLTLYACQLSLYAHF
jgi:hypothetical protein